MTDSAKLPEIRGVFLPLQSGRLLLPNAAVSEVVDYHESKQESDDAPEWLMGMTKWRGESVPLISFDALVGSPTVEIESRARIAICNTLNGNARIPFIAILLTSMPYLIRVSEEVVIPLQEKADLGKVVAQQVEINKEKAWIPDLDVLEKTVSQFIN